MYTRDGVRLDADIYRPDSVEQFPVLLMRQPYGRAIASTVVYAHPRWYATQGYIVVIQDVRGCGTSEGKFQLFANEIADGEDTVNWAAKLPGSNGNVGMYGFSYQGMTQLYAAAAKPSPLKTICPAMIGYDLYSDWAYEGGAFCLQNNMAWAIQLATENARLRRDKKAYQALSAASRNLPLNNPEILKHLSANSFYHDWLEHSQPDSYWEKLSPKTYLKHVDLPMFHLGGWFDTYLRGTLNLYKHMTARSQYRQQLLIGPWAHLPWSRLVGQMDFGFEAISPIDRMQIFWFDQILKRDDDTDLMQALPVWLFEMGSNMWQGFAKFPQHEQKSLFLSSHGLANMREDDGFLSVICPDTNINDILVHDPWRPVPSLGGHAGIPAGVFERSHIDGRSDVITYTTGFLEEDLFLTGDVIVDLWCTADKPTYDLSAVLSQMYPDGRVYNITQGYLRCQDGIAAKMSNKPVLRKIKLQTTCIQIIRGHALRLSLSAACFPAYAMNTGNNSALNMDAEVITLTVSCGGSFPSQVLLPVVPVAQNAQMGL
ncbi:MAG: CocE/NonD family hydrolase [Nostocaceae cyanobacterium]|nr:CocE/NonD family hydrolase [Nostocaceae cyanobacterium]